MLNYIVNRPPKLRIITTDDGSHTIYREDLHETYHSSHGAVGESEYVFIGKGFKYVANQFPGDGVRILEVGFGTGLNAFLTAIDISTSKLSVHYDALEPNPLPVELISTLNYAASHEKQDVFMRLHKSDWEADVNIKENFTLRKIERTLEEFETSFRYDLVYFDAFAPSKQPDIWSGPNLEKCYALMNNNGALVTYCAKGQFKRDLAAIGFEVETLPGALGKKEMVRAIK